MQGRGCEVVGSGPVGGTVAVGRAGAQRCEIKPLIRRYAPRFRKRILVFAERSDGHIDVVFTAPSIAIAITSGYAPKEARDIADRMIGEGRQLKHIERALGLPCWLRKLPPEAFREPLKAGLPGCDRDSDFGRQIANCIPKEADVPAIAAWAQFVLAAHACGGEDFALWAARIGATRGTLFARKHLALLAAFAWFSQHRACEAGHLIEAGWASEMSFARATALTWNWMRSVLFACRIAADGDARHWAETRVQDGFEIVPLRSAADLIDEAQAMDNCLVRYLDRVLFGRSHIYSVRRDGVRFADIEVRAGRDGEGTLVQVCGPMNSDPAPAALEAARAWLHASNKRSSRKFPKADRIELDGVAWRRLWQPYFDVFGETGALRAEPSAAELLASVRILSGFAQRRQRRELPTLRRLATGPAVPDAQLRLI